MSRDNHEEFPELTPEANAAYVAAFPNALDLAYHSDTRRAFSAFLLESIKQSGVDSAYRWSDGSIIGNLFAIARSLRNPPPPPPTLAEAREAARQLGGPSAEVVQAFLKTLGEGGRP